LGTWNFPARLYLYVSSAWGPGGLAARVGRHIRGSAAPRWHIDDLRFHARPVAVWLAKDVKVECAWAQSLLRIPDARVIAPGFGASDCTCVSHLV
jgi:Uri superfamily endonuclease